MGAAGEASAGSLDEMARLVRVQARTQALVSELEEENRQLRIRCESKGRRLTRPLRTLRRRVKGWRARRAASEPPA
jgi:hypothetical protein